MAYDNFKQQVGLHVENYDNCEQWYRLQTPNMFQIVLQRHPTRLIGPDINYQQQRGAGHYLNVYFRWGRFSITGAL